ncbi:GtrA family protein [Pseudomonas sp. GW101-3H06]|jgi:putative flippase GtrA|uniref:GtrA family protein n=1 Tax=Pseudomonas sp. GW101-3H06 TaxID=2751347 RepID=UPI001A921E98|nr:GtrA family protein [Pseudomonas sp. GW101-3H06]
MNARWKKFGSYAAVGAINTFVHWQIFFVLFTAAQLSQAVSNLAAFCVAASFAFYMNALFTFDGRASLFRYLLFLGVMALLSFAAGHVADIWRLHGWVTVASFSLLSLFCGFFFAVFVVCKDIVNSADE